MTLLTLTRMAARETAMWLWILRCQSWRSASSKHQPANCICPCLCALQCYLSWLASAVCDNYRVNLASDLLWHRLLFNYSPPPHTHFSFLSLANCTNDHLFQGVISGTLSEAYMCTRVQFSHVNKPWILVCDHKHIQGCLIAALKTVTHLPEYWTNNSSRWAFQQLSEIAMQPRAPVERHVSRICQSLVAKLQSCSCRGWRALGVLKMRIFTEV